MRRTPLRLFLLVALHAFLGIGSTPLARGQWDWAIVPLLIFTYSQASLAGVWAGLGTAPLTLRADGIMIAAIYICALWHTPNLFVIDPVDPELHLMWIPTVASALLTTALCACVRRWKAQLVRFTGEIPRGGREGLQFGLRHLLLVTTAIAVLLTLARILPLAIDNETDSVDILTIVLVEGVCFCTVTLASLWAAWGLGRPALRVGLVLLLSAAASMMPIFCFPGGRDDWYMWLTTCTAHAAVVLASLLVVRSCGYRLVPRARESAESGSRANALGPGG